MKKKHDVFDNIQRITESYLTHRANVAAIKKEKQQKKSVLADWVESFIWAVCVVLIINQYLFQAYQIPSGSMIDTLLIGDKIIVNKIIYGPELLPGIAKIKSPIHVQRNDVIIFENPDYISRGPVFDLAQRLIFMLTFSLVDIDKDADGRPRAHFLIKRAVGEGGDTFYNVNGNMYVQFAGEDRIIAETDYNKSRLWKHKLTRLTGEDVYPALVASGKAEAYMDMRLRVPSYIEDAYSTHRFSETDDFTAMETARLGLLNAAFPHEERFSKEVARRSAGRYVSYGRILPLGDNRDNSHDGRFFGPVKVSKILGRGAFKFWPHTRVGSIN
ncbi:MAG: signal peptidase I [Termitinemataceae bacterium]|nr:MAG: signal peptidase I [Termitinemataceae bacterium]